MKNKAYIITIPCSGKSTFIRSVEKKYKTLNLYDHDKLRACDCTQLYKLPPYSCILGGCHEPNIEEFIYAIVLLKHDVFWENVKSRKKNDPENGWTELAFTHKDFGYHAVRTIAEQYRIPIFETFQEALDDIIKNI